MSLINYIILVPIFSSYIDIHYRSLVLSNLIFCFYSILCHHYEISIHYNETMFSFFLYDLIKIYLTSQQNYKEYLLHHLYGMSLLIFRNPIGEFQRMLQYSEYSSFILNLTYLDCINQNIKNVLQYLFFCSFVYIRVYQIFSKILWLTYINSDRIDFYNWKNTEFGFYDFLSLVPFIVLHVHWVKKMVFKIHKKFKEIKYE